MSLLPDTDRVLLGPGPSLTAPRVMRAMASPTVSRLDPLMTRLLDDVRLRLARVFRAAEGSFAFAVSGTGTSGMETAVANLVKQGTRATVVVNGYFGDRVAQIVRAVRSHRHAAERRVGEGVRSRRAADAAEGHIRGRRGDGARGNVDRRGELGARAGSHREETRRADDRRRGHV